MAQTISHALVLPDADFMAWLQAADAYTKAFERVGVIRSPAGNDLNRFRDITAVEAPGVWVRNNALDHIRRIYPMVVRVDVIRASTPAQLAAALQGRISWNDRYGAYLNDGHISDRFILEGWPSEARPARIVRGFDVLVNNRKHEGLDLHAPTGTVVRCVAAGTVATVVRQPTALGYGQYVQVSSTVGGQTYLVTYAFLKDIGVNAGQMVNLGDVLGKSSQNTIKIVVQQPGKGLKGYPLPDVIDPIPLIYWLELRLKTNTDGLRIRERPGTIYKALGLLKTPDRAETLEPHGRTLLKVGVAGQWLKLRSPQGVEGYAAAEYLEADETNRMPPVANMTGVNLDILHALGRPEAKRLQGVGWVRFAYNVSMGRGLTDLNTAYNLYAPHIERYRQAGLGVILVLSHQTFGEGQGYVWPTMTTAQWRDLTAKYADFARRIASQYAGRGLVYQVWNEQDAASTAAVAVPIADYGYLLGETIKAIRSADARATVITGGHVGGPKRGAAYAAAALAVLPNGVRPDGIACHSYGRGPVGSKYSPFGAIDDDVEAYGKVLPGAPIWITEWGVLDHPNDPVSPVTDYATGFIDRLKRLYSGKVTAAIWYAWADGMHNGYGLVNASDQPKEPLYSKFLRS